MGKAKVDLPKDKIADFCRKWKIHEFALFGSVLREDFRPESDVDVLVDFDPNARRSLLDIGTMVDELQSIFDRKVDLLTRKAVEESRNYIRRREILSSIEVIYVS